MTALEFFAAFVLLLLFCSLAIMGFYLITRGEKIKQPDGTYRKTGKIFKDWQIFWEQVIGQRRIYFIGDQLQDKIDVLKRTVPTFVGRIRLAPDKDHALIEDISATEREIMEDTLDCKVSVEENDQISLYNEEPEYYWPEFIRYPLSQCPPCMASVGGTLLYWPFVMLQRHAFDWADYKNFAYFFYWFIFCIALAAMNRLVHRHIGS